MRTASPGTDGSRETAVQSDSERDHQCAAHRRGCPPHRVRIPICAGAKTSPSSSSALPTADGLRGLCHAKGDISL